MEHRKHRELEILTYCTKTNMTSHASLKLGEMTHDWNVALEGYTPTEQTQLKGKGVPKKKSIEYTCTGSPESDQYPLFVFG